MNLFPTSPFKGEKCTFGLNESSRSIINRRKRLRYGETGTLIIRNQYAGGQCNPKAMQLNDVSQKELSVGGQQKISQKELCGDKIRTARLL